MSDDNLRVVMRQLAPDPFTADTLRRFVSVLEMGGYESDSRPREHGTKAKAEIEPRRIRYQLSIGEGAWGESDIEEFAEQVPRTRTVGLDLNGHGFDLRLMLKDFEGEVMARISVDAVYFKTYEEEAEPDTNPSSLHVTQAVVRLVASLADVFAPSRIYGGTDWQVHKVEAQYNWAGFFAELPWLFDLDPRTLSPALRRRVEREFPSTMASLADGRVLVAVSDNPIYQEHPRDRQLASALLSALQRDSRTDAVA